MRTFHSSGVLLGVVMPILPIVDLMILTAWTSLLGAFVLKAIRITTSYTPDLFGMGPMELTLVAAVLLLFALTLTARTWLKAKEYAAATPRDRAAETLQAYSAVQSAARVHSDDARGEPSRSRPPAEFRRWSDESAPGLGAGGAHQR
jgi:L-lactate permease